MYVICLYMYVHLLTLVNMSSVYKKLRSPSISIGTLKIASAFKRHWQPRSFRRVAYSSLSIPRDSNLPSNVVTDSQKL